MKLNGWQRLWVVAVVMWMLPVLAFSYELWPTASSVSKGDVYMRMKPDDGHRLSDYYDVVAIRLGGTNLMNPLIVRLQHDKDFLAASAEDQKAYLSTFNPDFAKASPLDQNAYLANITGRIGPSASIDGQTVQFVPGVSVEDQDKTIRAYRVALRRILTVGRVSFIGKAFGSWIVPICALYALGWTLGWVRRGFSGNDLGRAGHI